MSWDNESDNLGHTNLGYENQWKIALTKVDNSLKNIKNLYDYLKARFDNSQRSHSVMCDIELKRENLNPMIEEMSKFIADLDRLVMQSQNTTATAMKNQLKDIKRRAAEVTMLVQRLCSDINAELYNRQMARRESSINNHELGSNVNANPGLQMSVLDDAQLQIALEEQKQSEKLARDIITLENVFINFSTLIHEQGEVINHIESNINVAYEDVVVAEQNLQKAEEHKNSALKKKLCIIGIILAVLVVIALIIGLSVGLKK